MEQRKPILVFGEKQMDFLANYLFFIWDILHCDQNLDFLSMQVLDFKECIILE